MVLLLLQSAGKEGVIIFFKSFLWGLHVCLFFSYCDLEIFLLSSAVFSSVKLSTGISLLWWRHGFTQPRLSCHGVCV